MEDVAIKFLRILGLQVSIRYVRSIITSHAEYPSLLSIVDGFERLGVTYTASRIDRNDLNKISYPFLLPISKNGGSLLLIANVQDLGKANDELAHWDGVVVQADRPMGIVSMENERFIKEDKYVSRISLSLIVALSAFIFIPALVFFSWTGFILLATAIVGTGVGYVLVTKDIGLKYEAIDQFCNSGQKNSCDAILHSEAAKLFGVASLSDMVLAYFVFQLIVISIAFVEASALQMLLFLLLIGSFSTIPVVFYSIYYQKFVAKTWCRLCLIVDGLLLIQIPLFVFATNSLTADVNGNIPLYAIICLIGAYIVWSSIVLIKGLFKEGISAQREIAKVGRVKYSHSIFTHLLFQQRKIGDVVPFDHELILGNRQAPISLIVAINLYCSPCKKHFEKLSELISVYPQRLNVSFRILKSGRDYATDTSAGCYIINYWLKNYYNKESEQKNTQILLQTWFELMDLDKFKGLYPESDISAQARELEDKHSHWMDVANVKHTPTIFVNGYEFPEVYHIKDMESLIPGIVDVFEQGRNTPMSTPHLV